MQAWLVSGESSILDFVDGWHLATCSHDFFACMRREREKLSSPGSLLTRTLIPSEHGPIIKISFNLNDLGSISKYSHIED